MTTHFISLEVNQEESPHELHRAIEAELQQRGEPLRWAITEVQPEQNTVVVEAIVTQSAALTASTASSSRDTES